MKVLDGEGIRISVEGPISKVIIDRPDNDNAIDVDVLQSLALTLDKLLARDDIRVITLSGCGEKAFASGSNIRAIMQLGPRAIADYVELGQRVIRRIETCHVPVIAAVNGYALGAGMELALACDLIIASSDAKFGLPEAELGIIPSFGGVQRLVQRCGVGVTRNLVYSGEIIRAQEAYRISLIDKLCEFEELLALVHATAESIEAKAPLAIAAAKKVIRHYGEQSLLAGTQIERERFLELFQTADREEGMEAFVQQRAPKFIGK